MDRVGPLLFLSLGTEGTEGTRAVAFNSVLYRPLLSLGTWAVAFNSAEAASTAGPRQCQGPREYQGPCEYQGPASSLAANGVRLDFDCRG